MKTPRSWIVWLAIATLGTGCSNMLVGGECLAGYVEQAGSCVADPELAEGGGGGAGGALAGGEGPGGEAPQGGGEGTGATPVGSGGAGGGCAVGECGDPAGHVVAIGAPAGAALGSSQALEILTNAVLMSPHQPVRVLVPREHGAGSASTDLQLGLSILATSRGRDLTFDHVSGADTSAIGARLAAGETDVLLVPAHALGSESVTADRAELLAEQLQTFCDAGGIVIALDSATRPGSAASLLDASGLLPGLETEPVDSEWLQLSNWTDALAIGVVSPFPSASQVVGFTLPEASDAVVVLRSDDETPVVLHRSISAFGG